MDNTSKKDEVPAAESAPVVALNRKRRVEHKESANWDGIKSVQDHVEYLKKNVRQNEQRILVEEMLLAGLHKLTNQIPLGDHPEVTAAVAAGFRAVSNLQQPFRFQDEHTAMLELKQASNTPWMRLGIPAEFDFCEWCVGYRRNYAAKGEEDAYLFVHGWRRADSSLNTMNLFPTVQDVLNDMLTGVFPSVRKDPPWWLLNHLNHMPAFRDFLHGIPREQRAPVWVKLQHKLSILDKLAKDLFKTHKALRALDGLDG